MGWRYASLSICVCVSPCLWHHIYIYISFPFAPSLFLSPLVFLPATSLLHSLSPTNTHSICLSIDLFHRSIHQSIKYNARAHTNPLSLPLTFAQTLTTTHSAFAIGSSRQMTVPSGRRPATSPLARPRPSSKLGSSGSAGQHSEESRNQTQPEAASRRFEPSRAGFRWGAKQGRQQQDKEQSNGFFGRSVRRGAGWSKSRALTG